MFSDQRLWWPPKSCFHSDQVRGSYRHKSLLLPGARPLQPPNRLSSTIVTSLLLTTSLLETSCDNVAKRKQTVALRKQSFTLFPNRHKPTTGETPGNILSTKAEGQLRRAQGRACQHNLIGRGGQLTAAKFLPGARGAALKTYTRGALTDNANRQRPKLYCWIVPIGNVLAQRLRSDGRSGAAWPRQRR